MLLYLHRKSQKDKIKYSISSSIFCSKKNVDQNNSIQIEIIDLTEFLININKNIKILKLDVEGAEYNLLEKLINTNLYLKIDRVVAETHAHKIPELKAKAERLHALMKEKKVTNINLNWMWQLQISCFRLVKNLLTWRFHPYKFHKK